MKAELERRKKEGLEITTEKELAMAIGCAQSTMHDLLNSPDAKHSSLVPAVHAVFKWAPPGEPEAAPPIFSRDALEVAGMFDHLPEAARKLLRDQAEGFLRMFGKPPVNPE